MTLRKLLPALLVLICPQIFAAPGDSLRKAAAPGGNKLYAVVQAVEEGTNQWFSNVAPHLKLDAKTGYHWYQLKKTWAVGARYRLVIKQAPTSGLLYIFSVDGINTPKICQVFDLDSVSKAGGVFPDSGYTFRLNYTGQERLCLWYANNALADYEERIMDIELTKGEFIARNNGQLGKLLLQPSSQWYFIKKEIGFATKADKNTTPNMAVLPVVIEFEVK